MGGVSSAFEVLFFFGLNYFELKALDALFGLTFSALLGRFPTPRLARSRKTGAPTAPRRRSTGISATPRLPTPPFIDYERESLPAGLERVPVGDRAAYVGTPKLACTAHLVVLAQRTALYLSTRRGVFSAINPLEQPRICCMGLFRWWVY